jgi:GTP-binding protein HflX
MDTEVIITDTVGFIQDLPKELMEAFHATLDELSDADVILHVIDVSNPRYRQQKESVENILKKLELDTTPTLLVFNKIDRINLTDFDDQWLLNQGIPVSAVQKQTLIPLVERLESMVKR